jgi:hypothetical protein
MKLTEADIEILLATLRRTLVAARTVEIDSAVGIVHRDNLNTGYVESFPTDGRTFKITINGGATETRGEPIIDIKP